MHLTTDGNNQIADCKIVWTLLVSLDSLPLIIGSEPRETPSVDVTVADPAGKRYLVTSFCGRTG